MKKNALLEMNFIWREVIKDGEKREKKNLGNF